MIIAASFVSVLAAAAAFWLARQGLTAKPWLEQGVIGDLSDPETRQGPAARAGLWFFLAVIGALFALLASAYVLRMDSSDWRAAPLPQILWANTGVLIVSSLAMQTSVFFAGRDDVLRAKFWLSIGGVCAVGFLAGQLEAWRRFAAEGYFLATNPANAFFYLITGLHGVHLAGGLVVLAAAVGRAHGDLTEATAQRALRLCATYWHFLLAVWLILFALLEDFAGDIAAFCRGLIG